MKTRAAILVEMGRPRPYTESHPVVVDEVDLDGPGYGEVLVELKAAGICHSDLSVVDGSRPRPTPMVLGHEAAGIVRETGPGVTSLQPGDHVVFTFVPMCGRCMYCTGGRPALCELGNAANARGELLRGGRRFHRHGQPVHHHLGVSAFSQFTVAAEESLIKIDPDVPFEVAAVFGCAVMTGVGAVVNTARVEPGSSVAVFGLGGVGLAAVMGAVAAGAYPVVAVDVLPEKLEHARALGATHVVNAREADAVEAVRDLTGGGADYAIEAAGNADVLAQAYRATRRGGTTITVGLPHPEAALSIPAVTVTAEERVLRGSYMGSAVPRRDLPRFLRLFRAGRLPVDRLITHRIGLDEINQGFDRLAAGEAVRQVVLPNAG
ncbi:Alcohol dehydrogenase zinc-binding domain protein [Thermaerobacter marianensis DSM 12885]|uniref:Alcohol dehydrogenase zinc-binding domain protein n=1 Tax=Thermaerobacter marianensis (strain ATCC 700841 / DSM 12885 / JCM 10246 / 7p75a) TaxID=644966 RepID=E6SI94_THEM7|nr:zinc-dependent alcohol dehydrogenase family protein [Thermaerobacter marianensis]ADU51905.1 Alcohol dehydrogenase zinc-binding domain protein [Thermaerobacter marianensis DSM 12885]